MVPFPGAPALRILPSGAHMSWLLQPVCADLPWTSAFTQMTLTQSLPGGSRDQRAGETGALGAWRQESLQLWTQILELQGLGLDPGPAFAWLRVLGKFSTSLGLFFLPWEEFM